MTLTHAYHMHGTKTWTLRGGKAFTPAPFGIMGIVNITPDSFYDGGRHASTEAAIAHARQLLRDGAHILDLGAESSRPGATPVSPGEEQQRLLPVLRQLRNDGAPPLSVDTYHADTARAALEAGADIINDISACAMDPALREVILEHKPGYVLMHSRGTPETMQRNPRYINVVDEVMAFFESRLNSLVAAGLPEGRIVLDPGIGFGKCMEHNAALLQHIDRVLEFGRPVLMGLSMKSLFGALLGLPAEQRGTATQVATALLARRGVALHRVHDVADTARTLRLVQAMEKPA